MVRRVILGCVIGAGVALTGAHCASRTAPSAQPGMIEVPAPPDRGVPSTRLGSETVWHFEGFARRPSGQGGNAEQHLGQIQMPESALLVCAKQRVTSLELTPQGGVRAVTIATSRRYPERALPPGVHRFKRIALDADGYIVDSVPATAEDDCVLEIDATTPPRYSCATKDCPVECILIWYEYQGQLWASCECPVDP